MLSAGIVGLPNVGKSTLFNAVTRTHKAPAENYPFCTIDPNVGVVTVPDPRLKNPRDFALKKNYTNRDRVCGYRWTRQRRERWRRARQPIPPSHSRSGGDRAGGTLF